jgi:mannose-6-phosphate isomerase-like protein (cupin superfamily)
MKNVYKVLEEITEYWSPVVVSQMNDNYIKVAKLKGDFVRHNHKDSDEVFFVIKGSLVMEYDDHSVVLNEGDMHTVKQGLYHNPIAKEECHVVFFEQKDTAHTGDVITDKTKSIEDQLKG